MPSAKAHHTYSRSPFLHPHQSVGVCNQSRLHSKDNQEYHDPPPEGLPLPPAPPENAGENEVPFNEFYHMSLSALEGSIASVEDKLAEVIENPYISPSNVKKMARKLGRNQKYLKSFKEKPINLESNETAPDVAQEEGIVDKDVPQEGMDKNEEEEALEQGESNETAPDVPQEEQRVDKDVPQEGMYKDGEEEALEQGADAPLEQEGALGARDAA